MVSPPLLTEVACPRGLSVLCLPALFTNELVCCMYDVKKLVESLLPNKHSLLWTRLLFNYLVLGID